VKEHVIYLEPGDDVHSTLDKLSWVKSSRVLIVWPDKGHPLASRFELTRLVRYAQQRGVHMGVVTFDPEVRANARMLGVPLFSSLEHRPEKNWASRRIHSFRDDQDNRDKGARGSARVASEVAKPTRPEQLQEKSETYGWDRKPGIRFLSIFLITCAILGLTALFIPSARIYLSPQTSIQEAVFELLYDHESQQLSPAGIPAAVKDLNFSVDDYFFTTGSAEVPDQHARGAVVFKNFSSEFLTIPAGTGLRNSDGIRFISLKGVILEPYEESDAVLVEAILPGEGGNVGPDEIQWIEGDLGLAAGVINPEALSGGTSIRVRAASQIDFQSARQDLVDRITDEMHYLAVGQLEQGEIMVPGSLILLDVGEEEAEVEIGEPAEGFQMRMSAAASFAVLDESILQQYAGTLILEERDPDPVLVPGSLNISLNPVLDAQKGEGFFPVELVLRYRTAEPVDLQDLQSVLAGRPVKQAAADLQAVHALTSNPIIYSAPVRLPVFPFVPSRIQVLWVWEVP